jgi:hypothetical protein
MDAITETIYIGNYLDAQDIIRHRAEGIRSMVSLDGKLRDVEAATMGLEALAAFSLEDGPGNDREIFERVVKAIGRLSRQHPKVLVQCHAGRSRSVIAVAAHLMRTNSSPPGARSKSRQASRNCFGSNSLGSDPVKDSRRAARSHGHAHFHSRTCFAASPLERPGRRFRIRLRSPL